MQLLDSNVWLASVINTHSHHERVLKYLPQTLPSIQMYIHWAMQYDWDDAKNDANIQNHGLDFADVIGAFDYPMLCDLDEREDYGEDRWIGLGILPNGIVVVVLIFTEPAEDVTRIISARRATNHERERYFKEIGY